jgi:cupin fold WbuC family metalloprotein
VRSQSPQQVGLGRSQRPASSLIIEHQGVVSYKSLADNTQALSTAKRSQTESRPDERLFEAVLAGRRTVTTVLKTVTAATIDELVARAAASQRRRTNHNLHETLSDPVSRFLNVGTAGTYVRPHRHAGGRWELFVVLRGRLDIVTFTADGAVEERLAMSPDERPVVEIPGNTWHTILSAAPTTVALEVKPGPYDAATDKVFADWAPSEGDARAEAFLRWLETAGIGDNWRTPDGRG